VKRVCVEASRTRVHACGEAAAFTFLRAAARNRVVDKAGATAARYSGSATRRAGEVLALSPHARSEKIVVAACRQHQVFSPSSHGFLQAYTFFCSTQPHYFRHYECNELRVSSAALS